MLAVASNRADLHSFHLAHPVVRRSSRFELTAVLSLSMCAMTLWLLVIPVEFVFHVTGTA